MSAGNLRTLQPYVRSARPGQWFRNLLVFAAPIAAGTIGDLATFRATLIAFVAFCFASSGIYYLNDVVDIDADSAHATKRKKPIASGTIGTFSAIAVGGLLVLVSLGIASLVSWGTVAVLLSYVLLTTGYSLYLKHKPVLDLMTIALGFLLRAIAGGVATGTALSRWFIIVVGFGSLFAITVKRSAEYRGVGGSGDTRGVLTLYTDRYFANVRIISLSAALVAYCLWAFERAEISTASVPWSELSIIPVTYGFLKYELLAETTAAEKPEDLVLSDVGVLVAGFVWALLFGLGIVFG
jgi:decaprenyl-phosphate phosphoribosyltransferase